MTLPSSSFDQFKADMLAAGYDEVLERPWAPLTVVPTHTHSFEANALIVQGEMWLTRDGAERRMVAGDRFQLRANVPHAERYGPEGATYWVARRAA